MLAGRAISVYIRRSSEPQLSLQDGAMLLHKNVHTYECVYLKQHCQCTQTLQGMHTTMSVIYEQLRSAALTIGLGCSNYLLSNFLYLFN